MQMKTREVREESWKCLPLIYKAPGGILYSCTLDGGIVGNEGTVGSCGSACSRVRQYLGAFLLSTITASHVVASHSRPHSLPRSDVAATFPVALICNFSYTDAFLP